MKHQYFELIDVFSSSSFQVNYILSFCIESFILTYLRKKKRNGNQVIKKYPPPPIHSDRSGAECFVHARIYFFQRKVSAKLAKFGSQGKILFHQGFSPHLMSKGHLCHECYSHAKAMGKFW